MNDLSSAATVWSVESSNFQVTAVPTATVRLAGMNMKLLISTVDPLAAGAPPDAVFAAADAGVLAPPPFELEPHALATAVTAISATKTTSARRGRSEAERAHVPIVRIMMCLSQSETAPCPGSGGVVQSRWRVRPDLAHPDAEQDRR